MNTAVHNLQVDIMNGRAPQFLPDSDAHLLIIHSIFGILRDLGWGIAAV